MATPWRDDPLLQGKFHPTYPDDLQVLVHEGGPRLTSSPPEVMWVRLDAVAASPIAEGVYQGALLNKPHRLATLTVGATILVLPTRGSPHPIRTTLAYLAERASYEIVPCDTCGFAELFDAPSVLCARIFSDLPEGAVMKRFSTFCPLCRGVQYVVADDARVSMPVQEPDLDRTQPPGRWWEFWRKPE